MRRIVLRLVAAGLLFASGLSAARALDLSGDFVQGGFIVGRTDPGATVRIGDRPVRVSPEGLFAFGFGRDHGPTMVLHHVAADGTVQDRTLTVKPRDYRIQRIDGLPQKMVTPPADLLTRIRAENVKIAEVRALDTPVAFFGGHWIWPVIGPISGVFGSQRILNGKPRRPHYGVDVAVPVGTPVVAPARGIVRLAETDLYYTGGTVILDHGAGVTSLYMHMDSVTVPVGQQVAQGDQIGTVGATGRATGPHLDWRVNWFDERLDPQLIVGPMPGQ